MKILLDTSSTLPLSIYVVRLHMGGLNDSACVGTFNTVIFHDIGNAVCFSDKVKALPYTDDVYDTAAKDALFEIKIAISQYRERYLYNRIYPIIKYTINSEVLSETDMRKELIDDVLKEL